jgi:3-dehydroquinate dehydratase
LNIPIIEVHLENIFLTGSNISAPLKVPESDAGFIAGLGIHGYLLAIQSLATKINI